MTISTFKRALRNYLTAYAGIVDYNASSTREWVNRLDTSLWTYSALSRAGLSGTSAYDSAVDSILWAQRSIFTAVESLIPAKKQAAFCICRIDAFIRYAKKQAEKGTYIPLPRYL